MERKGEEEVENHQEEADIQAREEEECQKEGVSKDHPTSAKIVVAMEEEEDRQVNLRLTRFSRDTKIGQYLMKYQLQKILIMAI